MSVASDTLYQRAPDVVSADMDGEPVIMSLQENAYFGITGIGGRIWDMLEVPQSLDSIVEHVCAEYDVDPETCRRDVTLLLLDLHARGLVQTL